MNIQLSYEYAMVRFKQKRQDTRPALNIYFGNEYSILLFTFVLANDMDQDCMGAFQHIPR